MDTLWLSKVNLTVGDLAFDYVEPNISEELLRCQRYWQLIGGTNAYPQLSVYCESGDLFQGSGISFPVRMRTTPTAIEDGDWVTIGFGAGDPTTGSKISING